MREVAFYFDFISPYSYIAMMRAREFAEEHGVRWRLRPVVLAKLLDEFRLVGPAEVEVKRRLAFADAARSALVAGVPFAGPPAHPFRSLDALRLVCVHLSLEPRVVEDLTTALFRACWGQGRDLADFTVLADVTRAAGLNGDDLAMRLAAPEAKQALVETTAEAIERGVFGVPTFAVDGELFWGQDRMDHLAGYLLGEIPPMAPRVEEMLARPQAVRRPGAPR